jgi:hypothetical protein
MVVVAEYPYSWRQAIVVSMTLARVEALRSAFDRRVRAVRGGLSAAAFVRDGLKLPRPLPTADTHAELEP